MNGSGLLRATWVGTAVFAATAVAAVASDATAVRALATATALALFAAGTLTMLGAVVVAAARSRTDEIAVGSLFLFQGGRHGPGRALHGATVVQTLIALTTAFARPYTSLAFGILVPIFGLGVTGLWGARHGTFPPRPTGPQTRSG